MKSHSLLELSESIERVITHTFNKPYWVRAEISRLNYYPKSGHCYPELVEKQNGKIVAEIRSTIWRDTFKKLIIKFKNQTGEDLKEGMSIMFLVHVNYSPSYGISLNINNIDPSFTMGEMVKEKKNTIDTLKKEGLFDLNRQLSIPYFPNRLAIISVSTSKGYHDFLETIRHKADHFNIQMELFPAILQGDTAVKSITEQLDLIQKRVSEFDLVLIIRGGGGDVGLHCYNHLEMAKKVVTFPLPVISGIGHSTNMTVVEMVANTNKITPTAVADGLVERYKMLESGLQNAQQLVTNIHSIKIAPQWQRLINTIRFLRSSSSGPLTIEKLKIQQLTSNLNKSTQVRLNSEHANLSIKIGNQLKYVSISKLNSYINRLNQLESKLKVLDPVSVLKRGFSMSMINQKTISNVNEINKGDILKTVLSDGTIESKITNITSNE